MNSLTIAAFVAGLLIAAPFHLAQARAGCSAQEKGEIKRLLPGAWRQYLDDSPMCVTQTFARHGLLIKAASHCGGDTGPPSAPQGSWRIDDDCQLVEEIDGKEDKYKLDFVDDNKWIVKGCPGCFLAPRASWRRE
jgi:hypothetical protein